MANQHICTLSIIVITSIPQSSSRVTAHCHLALARNYSTTISLFSNKNRGTYTLENNSFKNNSNFVYAMAVRGQKAQLSAGPRRRASVARCILMRAGFCRATAWERCAMIDIARVYSPLRRALLSDCFLPFHYFYLISNTYKCYTMLHCSVYRND